MPVVSVLLRVVVAVVVFAPAMALALLSAVPYGGGSKLLFALAWFVTMFMTGWAFLPLVRSSRSVGLGLYALWGLAGLFLLIKTVPLNGGATFALWVLATLALMHALSRNPPEWAPPRKPKAQRVARPGLQRLLAYTYMASVVVVFISVISRVVLPDLFSLLMDIPVMWALTGQGYLIPAIGFPLPRALVMLVSVALLALIVRRFYLASQGEPLPASFRGVAVALAYAGLAYLCFSSAVFAMQLDLDPSGFLTWISILGSLCLPWAVVLTEAADLWGLRGRSRPQAG